MVWVRSVLLVAAALGLAACSDDGGTDPGSLRFGQIGRIQVDLTLPLRLGSGRLEQTIVWSSMGPWELSESISYQGVEGDATMIRSRTNPEVLAGSYAQWITQVNEISALRLFVPELDPDLDPDCGLARSRVRLSIQDEARDERIDWVRCVEGTLGTVISREAGPDLAAARVASAIALLTAATVGEDFLSEYHASVPFATIARGEDSFLELESPIVISRETDWTSFWEDHTNGASEPPAVDFGEDIVLVGAVGQRQEAGDSVEIRRVLAVGEGTVVTLFERIPGDFCAPAELLHYPFHIVRAPIVPRPVTFADAKLELVSCGT